MRLYPDAGRLNLPSLFRRRERGAELNLLSDTTRLVCLAGQLSNASALEARMGLPPTPMIVDRRWSVQVGRACYARTKTNAK